MRHSLRGRKSTKSRSLSVRTMRTWRSADHIVAIWRELLRLYEDIKREKVVDAYHIFRKMRREGFFSLHAALRAMPSSTNTVRTTKTLDDLTTDTINTDTLTGVLDLD